MPYITKCQRAPLKELLRPLILRLEQAKPENIDGELNYCITVLLRSLYRQHYFELNRALGVLEAAKLEYYRRSVAPYEDKKITENGDVP